MGNLLQDLRLGARSLRRTPGFAAAAVLTLALGIAATTTLFSVVYGVLLRPLPFSEPDRIVELRQVGENGGEMNLSLPNYVDLRERSRSFSAVSLVSMTGTVSVLGGSEPARASLVRVSRDYLDVLGVQPQIGRGFVEEELVEGGSPAVLVSHEYWQRYLGGRADALGTALTFDGGVYGVVGVLPPRLGYPAEADLVTSRELEPSDERRTAHNWRAFARLAPGVPLESARQELSAAARELKQIHGDDSWMVDADAVPLHERIVSNVRPALLVLLGAAALLFLIATANVASLLLTRATARRREMAVRLALGARRSRLVQGAVAEALILTVTAAALGMLLTYWGVEILRLIAPPNLPRAEEIRIDALVLAVALVVTIVTALVLGIGIGGRGLGGGMREALSERRSSGGRATGRAHAALVTAQVALTVVLLVGAGLLGRSFFRLLSVDPGYRTTGAAVMSLVLEWPENEADAARQVALQDELMQRLSAIPGVQNVGGANGLPIFSGHPSGNYLLLERPDEVQGFEDWEALSRIPGRVGYAEYRIASGGYFAAMDVPLLRGRTFLPSDHVDAPHVAVVSESFARQSWPNEDPLGKLVQFGNMDGDIRAFTVVGVVGDARQGGLDGEQIPTLYGSSRQRIPGASRFEIVIHGPADPRSVIPTARNILRELAPQTPPRLRTLDEIFSSSIAQRRFSLLLFGVFGAAALLLAMIGLYGVIAYTVAQRTHEIGVRIALGARATNVTGLMVRQGAVLAAIGIGAGLLASLALTRLISGLLFGVSATDPLAYAAVTLLLGAVALLASYIPARRATRVDPMNALRAD